MPPCPTLYKKSTLGFQSIVSLHQRSRSTQAKLLSTCPSHLYFLTTLWQLQTPGSHARTLQNILLICKYSLRFTVSKRRKDEAVFTYTSTLVLGKHSRGLLWKEGQKNSLTVPFIILMSDNWRNTLSEECVMRKCFIIDVCDQYANGMAKTSHSDWKGGGWEKSPVQGNGPRHITTPPTPT